MITGRQDWKRRLSKDFEQVDDPVIWFHCASLGEFEQGRPLIDVYNRTYPNHKILLTFFSPSGYEVRKDYPAAFAVHYLPWDTASNARFFYETVKPIAGIIIKYEYWHHMINEGWNRNTPVMVCSAIFRENQIFFKSYGSIFREMLKKTDQIFVQDKNSANRLMEIGIDNVKVAGDTRVDRVAAITMEVTENQIVERFLNGSKGFIIGSSWPQDIELLAPFINDVNHKFIIAPHEVNNASLEQLEKTINKPTTRYSSNNDSEAEVLIIDTIGILSHLYRHGLYAYIGGAFGKGLHNILEAATFGLPLFFGNKNYEKFAEAVDLVKLGGAFAIGDIDELKNAYSNLEDNDLAYTQASNTCREYIKQKSGATEVIMHYLKRRIDEGNGS